METKQNFNLLTKPLPAEAIKPHPTKKFLSSIKGIYVTERLNEVYGVNGWDVENTPISVNEATGMVIVSTTITFKDEKGNVISKKNCIAGNNNGGKESKNFDLGDAYKGAITDNMTKIGSWLGIGIDVFKGKSTPSSSSGKSKIKEIPDADKAWLNENTDAFNKVVSHIKNGGDLEDIYAKYKVSKAIRAKLEQFSNYHN